MPELIPRCERGCYSSQVVFVVVVGVVVVVVAEVDDAALKSADAVLTYTYAEDFSIFGGGSCGYLFGLYSIAEKAE